MNQLLSKHYHRWTFYQCCGTMVETDRCIGVGDNSTTMDSNDDSPRPFMNHGIYSMMYYYIRVGIVFITMIVMTWNYASYHHFVHDLGRKTVWNESIDDHFLDGFALPLLLLTLATLIFNRINYTYTSIPQTTTTKQSWLREYLYIKRRGDINVKKWTITSLLIPLLLIMIDAIGEYYLGSTSRCNGHTNEQRWSWCNSFLTFTASFTGYAAIWSLALFLVPVTKHSPILEWIKVTPVQALVFHRMAGWTSLWMSILHGVLHMRHQVHNFDISHDNDHEYTRNDDDDDRLSTPTMQKLELLLIPAAKCFQPQDPFGFLKDTSNEERMEVTCWLPLINFTGLVSVIAFILLAITSLPQVRRSYYTLFYKIHIPSAWIMLLTAIWHYEPCVLVLIPGIIYYLSFNIPVYMSQLVESLKRSKGSNKKSPLVEVNLIQGGAVELIFATDSTDIHRHDSRFVRVYHPSISSTSHPFSIFCPQELKWTPTLSSTTTTSSSSLISTHAIILRPTGAFTKKLSQLFFPANTTISNGLSNDENDDSQQDKRHSMTEPLLQESSTASSSSSSSPSVSSSICFNQIQFDSFYAGSHDWVDKAITSHDDILIVAGGVGIVPFLEFLPSLYKQIVLSSSVSCTNTTSTNTTGSRSSRSSSTALDDLSDDDTHYATNVTTRTTSTSNHCGPRSIHLHWYCREVGLASYVWCNYLRPHIQNTWENDLTCQGRLKIHIHLTSLDATNSSSSPPSSSSSPLLPEEVLSSIPRFGLVTKKVNPHMMRVDDNDDDTTNNHEPFGICPVKDAETMQSCWIGLLLSGSIMLGGTIFHWWWYKEVVTDSQYTRVGNIMMRIHGILFTFLLAIVISFIWQAYRYWIGDKQEVPNDDGIAFHSTQSLSNAAVTTNQMMMEMENQSCTSSILTVSKGRPDVETVIQPVVVVDANSPGVYFCGPHTLMEMIEKSIGQYRSDCVFYREDSEM